MRERFSRYGLPAVVEIFLVFAVFALFGAVPVPDSNEPYYIGKAVHFWKPSEITGDVFLDSKDAHRFFYLTFGSLALFLPPVAMAWAGRLVCWGLMAWGWYRLSRALVPVRGAAVLTAAAMLFNLDTFHLAGEWIAGGVEGKTFAYPFVFFGLAEMLRNRWNRAWMFFGAASAFHPLVGGWAVVCSLFAWTTLPVTRRPVFFRMLPALLVGGLLSLPGLLPVLLLNRGTDPAITDTANEAYVYLRLYHHLVPSRLAWTFTARFLLLAGTWAALVLLLRSRNRDAGVDSPEEADDFAHGILIRFVAASLLLAGIGFFIDRVIGEGLGNRALAAKLLRFYWFRTSDWAVAAGTAFAAVMLLRKGMPGVGVSERFARVSPPSHPTENHAPEPAALPTAFQGSLEEFLGKPAMFAILLFGAYLLVDAMIFGFFFFSWNVKPDVAVVWGTVLFLFFLGVFVLARLRTPHQTGPFAARNVQDASVLMLLGLAILAPALHLATLGDQRTRFAYSTLDGNAAFTASRWIDACEWIRRNTPRDAKFLIPREATTFKWNARRADAGVWKDVPQDEAGIVRWKETMEELFSYIDENGTRRWDRSLTIQLWWNSDGELVALARKYGFDYVLCTAYPDLSVQKKSLKPVYRNEVYAVYRLEGSER